MQERLEMSPLEVKALVIERNDSKPKGLVDKPCLAARPGQKLIFDPGPHEARLWIPGGIVTDATEVHVLHGKPKELTVKGETELEDGDYPYAFYLTDLNLLLEGDSPPYIKIIKTTDDPSNG